MIDPVSAVRPRAFTIRAANGVAATITNLGATLMRIDAPDREGRFANILLGHDDPAAYPAWSGVGADAYLGATCGRVANRIAGAAFDLDGVHYALLANEGGNQLHGGPRNFHQALWRVAHVDAQGIVLRHRSPDGDQGFPGALVATACFALCDDGELAITYTATTSRPTHVNLVSHGYFNLSGGSDTTILDHHLRIEAIHMLPIDAAMIPTGERRPVLGTPFDFTTARRIGERINDDDEQVRQNNGYNHSYILSGGTLRDVAWLHHPASGRMLTIATDQPGLHLYSGNKLDGVFAPRSGVCLEAQHWPDSPNRVDFPSTRLDPGQTYRSETRLRVGIV